MTARSEILDLVARHHAEAFAPKKFVAGVTPVPVSGKVFDDEEIRLLIDASLDFWLTSGRYTEQFEAGLAAQFGLKHAVFCNSGSSANLLAVSALTSPRNVDLRLLPGDEVITVAAGFPTTVAPILQNGLVPVFLDVEIPTYNVDASKLEEAVGPKTRAIMLAHTLGNPFNLTAVMSAATRHGLLVIEDCCDALGSHYNGAHVGTLGDLATCSFYPAHHITTGEGGAVLTDSSSLKKVVESFRDWGRDCWCATGKDNTCGKRFDQQHGALPAGYDHKYVYSHVGYNLKATDMQAAIGVAQLKKLPTFIARRKRNFDRLLDGLRHLDFLIMPEASPRSAPSWFGFPLTVCGVERRDVIRHLEERKIATRMLFAGNILRQPGYKDIPRRVVGDLTHTDLAMRDTFWLGVYPGLTDEMVDYVVAVMRDFPR